MSRTVDSEDPNERRERIRRLKEAVASGTHSPDLDALAESLVDRLGLRRARGLGSQASGATPPHGV